MKKIIWIIAILFLAVLCYWFFNSMNNPSQNNNGVIGQLKSLFPYGVSNNSTTGSISQTTSPNNANTNNSTGNTTAYDPLIQLSKRGIVGMTVVTPAPQDMSSTSSQSNIPYQSTVFSKTKLPVVRFVEHGTGYVYDVDSRAQNETKQTGTTVLRTYEASFGNYGNSIIFRYVKNDNSTIETYLGNIIPPTDSNSGQFASVKGTFLPENISDLLVNGYSTLNRGF